MNTPARILVVEDERLIALDLSRRLPRLGYEVLGMVPTGEEAVQQAAALKPDLVLMDICLRGPMDGIGAAELIRKHNASIPVIFLTANSDELTVSRSKSSLPSSYVLKPFKERELQICIEMALLNNRLQVELKAAHDNLEARVVERTAELAQVNATLQGEIEVRKRTEAQAREQADLLAKARDAIYVRDLRGTISYWNPSAERLYGIRGTEAIGQNAPALIAEEGDDAAAQAERATLEHGEWTGELRHHTRTGVPLIVESRWTLVRDEAGKPTTILVVNTDITERKKSEEQFLRTQRLESVGTLASGVAHDLNNVFAPILLASDLMIKEPEADKARMIEIVKESAWRGTNMVRQILMFVRGGSNQLEPTALDHLTGEVRKLMQETLPCTIRVKAEITNDLGLVNGDATQLHQVLVNLCVNARDAMPDGGELRLQLNEAEVDEAKAQANGNLAPGRYARLVVGDTGTGIPPEVRDRIFDPFFTTKEVGKGTGLGLSTVATIVRNHKGFLEVESRVGRGTQFIIYLPLCETQPVETGPVVCDLKPGQGELIILADDDHSVREITKLTLEANNYRVMVASDGAEALSLYIQNPQDTALVISDVMMPIMNGRALTHALRKMAPHLPILIFTAAETSNSLVGSLEEEHVPMLRKPAQRNQLLATVAEVMHPVATAPNANILMATGI